MFTFLSASTQIYLGSFIYYFRDTSVLEESGVSSSNHGEYLKWLRFYHHFCRKYKYHIESENSLQPFLEKLESKNNSKKDIITAKKAVELFFNLLQTIIVNKMQHIDSLINE